MGEVADADCESCGGVPKQKNCSEQAADGKKSGHDVYPLLENACHSIHWNHCA